MNFILYKIFPQKYLFFLIKKKKLKKDFKEKGSF